eukprot:1147004-Pelagomonas_calceolata.AAC.13
MSLRPEDHDCTFANPPAGLRAGNFAGVRALLLPGLAGVAAAAVRGSLEVDVTDVLLPPWERAHTLLVAGYRPTSRPTVAVAHTEDSAVLFAGAGGQAAVRASDAACRYGSNEEEQPWCEQSGFLSGLHAHGQEADNAGVHTCWPSMQAESSSCCRRHLLAGMCELCVRMLVMPKQSSKPSTAGVYIYKLISQYINLYSKCTTGQCEGAFPVACTLQTDPQPI